MGRYGWSKGQLLDWADWAFGMCYLVSAFSWVYIPWNKAMHRSAKPWQCVTYTTANKRISKRQYHTFTMLLSSCWTVINIAQAQSWFDNIIVRSDGDKTSLCRNKRVLPSTSQYSDVHIQTNEPRFAPLGLLRARASMHSRLSITATQQQVCMIPTARRTTRDVTQCVCSQDAPVWTGN